MTRSLRVLPMLAELLLALLQSPAAAQAGMEPPATELPKFPIAGLDFGLETWRSDWTGPTSLCAGIPHGPVANAAGAGLLGAAIGGIVGAAVGGNMRSIRRGALIGGVAVGALGLRQVMRHPAAERDLCDWAREDADNVGIIVNTIVNTFGARCDVSQADFLADPMGTFNVLRRCDGVPGGAVDRYLSDIASLNHQACSAISLDTSSTRKPAPSRGGLQIVQLNTCPYPVRYDPPAGSPPEQVLARISAFVYTMDDAHKPVLPIAPYRLIDAQTSARSSMVAALFQNGNQYVVAFRGTVFDALGNFLETWNNLGADMSWLTRITPSARLFMQDAANALLVFRSRHPGGEFTLTGHSLGGAAALWLGNASHLPSAAFDAPQSQLFYQGLPIDFGKFNAGFKNRGGTVNYRMHGDWVSKVGANEDFATSYCTITDTVASTMSRGLQHALANHSIVLLSTAIVANARTGGFIDTTAPFAVGGPCVWPD